MKKLLAIGSMIIFSFGFRYIGSQRNDPAEIKQAVQKSITLLENSSHVFVKNAACYSCHGQCMGAISFSMARDKGIITRDSILTEAQQIILDAWEGRRLHMVEYDEMIANDISYGYSLWGLYASHVAANKLTTLMVNQVLERQNSKGYWAGGNGRPPLEYYSISATAMAIYAMNVYAPPGFHDRVAQAKEKAKEWLLSAAVINNEEKAFQLLGLKWTGADPGIIKKQAAVLIAQQQPGGGWSQLELLPADAYATGQALYALNQSGALPATDEAYQKGISFLLNTQQPDGSWHVKTRSFPVVPFVDSGFPYEKDQFISAAGTNWAAMALLLAIK